VYSLVVPVYRNQESIPELLDAVGDLDRRLGRELEVVFVDDGSPDRSGELLASELPKRGFDSQLLTLSRNFGSFAAIREGLKAAEGPLFAIMAADLQEPPDLVLEFFRALESEPVDVVIGQRTGRDDPATSRWASRLFWGLYRRLVQPEMPPGGVDVFGCNRSVRDRLADLREANSSLVELLFWVGFRRKAVPYHRAPRARGRSGWTLSKKLRYFSDSVFGFSDLPIRLLLGAGALGMLASLLFGVVVFAARLLGLIEVPGYSAIVVAISFFAALNMFGLGVIGSYVWRAFENTKGRPGAIVMSKARFGSGASDR
jgi:glycosyltransferase involved in cell wall biosynthesis